MSVFRRNNKLKMTGGIHRTVGLQYQKNQIVRWNRKEDNSMNNIEIKASNFTPVHTQVKYEAEGIVEVIMEPFANVFTIGSIAMGKLSEKQKCFTDALARATVSWRNGNTMR